MSKNKKKLSITSLAAAVLATSAIVPAAAAETPAAAAELDRVIVTYNGETVSFSVEDYSTLLEAEAISPTAVSHVQLSNGKIFTIEDYSTALEALETVAATESYLDEEGTETTVENVKNGAITEEGIVVDNPTPSTLEEAKEALTEKIAEATAALGTIEDADKAAALEKAIAKAEAALEAEDATAETVAAATAELAEALATATAPEETVEVTVESVSAINATTVSVTFPEGSEVTAEDLAGQTVTLTAGEETLTATYVANSFGNGVAQFKLAGTDKLTDAAEYTVSAEWATFTKDTFVAKVAAVYAADFVVTTGILKADADAANPTAKTVNFKVLNQYGEEITSPVATGFKVEVKKGNFPVATTSPVGANSFDITGALVDGETVTVTLTNTVDGKVVATSTATLTVSKDVSTYSGVSDIKVSKGINLSTTDLKLDDLKAGDKFELSAQALDGTGNPVSADDLRWTTSDSSVVALFDPTANSNAGAVIEDLYEDAKAITLQAGKEGTATITAFTLDGNYSKEFTVTVGKGKLATITTSDVTSFEVTNKVETTASNIVVNEATTGENAVTDFVKFTNANGAKIPVKAEGLTFEVVAPTGFEASDVTVEKVTDADGYLTGLKVSSNRTALTAAEKTGDYTTGQAYTVKVKSSDTTVSEATFSVTSKIDSVVKSIETTESVELRAGNKVQNALVFKNAQGETLNVKASDLKVEKPATAATLALPTFLKTVDGKFDTAGTSDVVTGIEIAPASTTTAGTYNILVKQDIVTKYIAVKVNAPATVETINGGANVAGVIAGDAETAKVNEVKFFDQDANATTVKLNAATDNVKVSVKKPDGNDLASGDVAKLVTLGKSYTVAEDGTATFTAAAAENDEVKFIKVDADASLEAGVYTITLETNGKTATITAEVKAERALTSATFEVKASTLTPTATTKVVVVPKDQYGKIVTFTPSSGETLADYLVVTSGTTGTATVSTTWTVETDTDNNVIGYSAEVTGVAAGTTELSLSQVGKTGAQLDATAIGKIAKQTLTVKAADEAVSSIEINETNLKPVYNNSGAAATVTLDVKAKDAAGNAVSIPTSDIVFSIAGAKDAAGNALILTKTAADTWKISAPGVTEYDTKEIKISAAGVVTAPAGVTLTVTAKAESHNDTVDTVELNFSKVAPTFVSGLFGTSDVAPQGVGASVATELSKLDTDKEKAGIQLSVEAGADLLIKLAGKDQYAGTIQLTESLATTLIGNSAVIGAVADGTPADAAEVLKVTGKAEGTTTLKINYGGETITVEVTVTPTSI